jgi:DNA-binding MarR family transcriptional regulator
MNLQGKEREKMKGQKSLTLKMHIIARLARCRFDLKARSIGLTSAQWRTIVAVRSNQGATQRRIATLLEVREVTAGRMIDKLIDEGLIERRRDEEDRRAYRLYLTPAATPVLAQLDILGADQEECALAGLSDDDLVRLHKLLNLIAANLGGAAPFPENAEQTVAVRREFEEMPLPD